MTTDTGCPDCNRREIALHTAQVNAQRDQEQIEAQGRLIETLRAQLGISKPKGKEKK